MTGEYFKRLIQSIAVLSITGLLMGPSISVDGGGGGNSVNVPNASPNLLPLPGMKALNKTTQLYYLTFAAGTNPQSLDITTICPSGTIYVNASEIQIPSFPNMPGPLGGGGIYMWQCIAPISSWITPCTAAGVCSAANTGILDYAGLDSTVLANSKDGFNQASPPAPNWESYTPISNAQYTGYQFPNNAYVPIGIGGSGLGCGQAGGLSTVTCTTGTGNLKNKSTKSGTWFFYLQPAQTATCTIHRDYGSTTPCSGAGCPCDTTQSISAGQAWVGACCNGTWKGTLTDFTNSNFNTCGGGC